MGSDPVFRGEHTAVLVAAAIGAALNPLNSTMVAVALPALSSEFAATPSSVTLSVVTGYLVATLIWQVPAGSIADRIGYSRALNIGRWLFLAGALAGALAPALLLVVVGRLLMAIGGSLIIPTAMALVRVAVAEERRARAFGTLGAVLGGAAALGPALGTWMASHFGWRSLFIVNVPMVIASWAVQRLGSAETPGVAANRSRARGFDALGSLLIGLVLVLFTFATRSTGPTAWGLAVAGAVAAAALLWQERRAPAPVLRLSLFSERGFLAGSGVIATQNLAMYSLLLLVPFIFGSSSGADARLGLAIIAMTATMAVTSPLGGWLADRFGARVIVTAGGTIGAAGVLGLMPLPPDAGAVEIGWYLLLVGLGLGLSTGPSQAIALKSVAPEQSGVAAATVSMLRYLGAVVGTVIVGYALGGGADSASRVPRALLIFAAAFGSSAVLGALFPAMRRLPKVPASSSTPGDRIASETGGRG
jgi:MFS family permease